MKNIIFLLFIQVLVSQHLFSQYYFYVSPLRDDAKPNYEEKGLSNNEVLNQIFKEFKVTNYYQSFPGAKNIELQNFYEIHFTENSDSNHINSFENLLKESNAFTAIYRSDYYELACDYSVEINDTWIINNQINNNALNLLDAQCAWTITKGDSNIIVGVIDIEFDITHEDMINTFAGVVGTRTYTGNHGTAVSSCVATGTNNNKGIAGIGYNTRVKGYHVNDITNGVWSNTWQAYQDGIKIINVSWSGIGAYPNLLAVQEMTENGVVLVVAAGNTPTSTHHSAYANIPGVINVSGVDANNNHGNTGHAHNQWIDVCAPGKDVLRGNVGNIYQINEGTSLAAPFVAGTIALMLSVNPNLSPAEIEDIIKVTADPIADGHLYPGLLGAGRINAYEAVKQAQCIYSPTLDLYIKDHPKDFGVSGDYNRSDGIDNPPDMWIRNQPDGRINQTDQAPEYSPGNPIYVYVKVRNKSCVPSIGTEQLRVYWSKSSGWTSWPENWDGTDPSTGNIIGMVNIGNILPYKDSIYEFMWNIYNTFQNGNWHQCLAARIENSTTDPITINFNRFDDDIYFNNNIAAKNVVISDLIPNTTINSCGGYINIGNPTNQLVTQNFSLSESKIQGESGFLREGEITISFDSVGWQFFHPFLVNNKEIEILQSGKIKILTSDFRINNIQYPINTVYPIFIEYRLISSRSSKQKRFKLDLQEYLVDTVEIPLGGVYFTINKPDFEKFYAETEKHQIKVNSGDLLKLSAVEQVGNFEYNWYDNNGNLLGSGSSIEASSPDQSATYYLQVLSRDFCITDRSDLSIIVNPNYIVSISPNPANSKIKVEYKLLNVGANSNAQFNIINQFGTIQTTQSINITQNTAEISVGSLLPGTYMLQLMVDNNVSDTEIFIKQ